MSELLAILELRELRVSLGDGGHHWLRKSVPPTRAVDGVSAFRCGKARSSAWSGSGDLGFAAEIAV